VASSFNLTKILHSLTCPILSTPLIEAVAPFANCCHRVNQIAAEELYAATGKNTTLFISKLCKYCKCEGTPFQQKDGSPFFPDPVVRKLARQFSSHITGLPTRPLTVQSSHRSDLSYPGERVVFMEQKGDWDRVYKPQLNQWPCRHVEFWCRDHRAIIAYFAFYGYTSGKIKMSIHPSKNSTEISKYFFAHKIPWPDLPFTFTLEGIDQIISLFDIICKNNEISLEYLTRASQIIKTSAQFQAKSICEPKPDQFDADTVLGLLKCPSTKRLLIEAVNLFPCCHKVNEVAVSTLKECPVCNKAIVGFVVDQTMRSVAVAVNGYEKELEALSQTQPASNSIPAIFACSTWDWSPVEKMLIRRQWRFISLNQASLLQCFELDEYKDGDIGIFLSYRENKGFEQLLHSNGLSPDGKGFVIASYSQDHFAASYQKVAKLFRLVAQRIEISADDFYKMHAILERGYWNAFDLQSRKWVRSIVVSTLN
jgi:hypothetical protein